MPHQILVVDDDPDIRESLTWLLESEGFRVSVASSGREALEQLHGGDRPCLILLDLMMPVMSGQDFRARQLADPAIADVPVVVLTADVNARSRTESLRAAEVLIKPFDFDHVLETIGKHC